MIVDVKFDDLRRSLERLSQSGLDDAASHGLAAGLKAAEEAALAVIDMTTVRRTGALRDGTLAYQRSSRQGIFFSSAKHAIFVNDGTRPHVIEARRAKMLRFEIGGQTIFRRRVNHPGTKPRPFAAMARAAGEAVTQIAAQARADEIAAAFNR